MVTITTTKPTVQVAPTIHAAVGHQLLVGTYGPVTAPERVTIEDLDTGATLLTLYRAKLDDELTAAFATLAAASGKLADLVADGPTLTLTSHNKPLVVLQTDTAPAAA